MTSRITPLGERQVDALCEIAAEIWRQHYPPIIGAEQTEYMLAQRYAPSVIRAELTKPDVWWDVLSVCEQIVAFASSVRTEPTEMKLDKLYVLPEKQRRGYGAALIEHACHRAKRLGCDTLALAVNKRNTQAIAAYHKHGFHIREATVKAIGGGFVMDDYIMARPVRVGAAHPGRTLA